MKYLLALSILIVVLLLTPSMAVGQELYTVSNIWYNDWNDCVATNTIVVADYYVQSFYTISAYASLSDDNQVLMSDGPVVEDPNNNNVWPVAYTIGQPDTTYYSYGTVVFSLYYYYPYYDPYYCYIYPYNCDPNGYYFAFMDPYNYYGQRGYCDGISPVSCPGGYPPKMLAAVLLYDIAHASNSITTPPPPPPCPKDEMSYLMRHYRETRGSVDYNGGVFGGLLLDKNAVGQLIVPPNGTYLGRTVSEDFDASVNDGCRSAYGGTIVLMPPDKASWPVLDNNMYGSDYVGVPAAWVDYYIGLHVSCSATITQKMSISGCSTEYNQHQQDHVIDGIPPGHNYNPTRGGVGGAEDWPWPY
jgi:hypothetical protein